MKKFLLKSLFFIIILFTIASILQSFIDRGLKKSSFGNFKEWNDILHSKINADLIVQGSSRALVHFSPYLLDSAFRLNSYNLGIDGLQFRVQYYRFLFYLEYNKKPKYIIQDVDHLTLNTDLYLYGYSQFLPYLNDSIMKQAVISYHGLNWEDLYIPMYKYHSDFNLAFQGFMGNFHPYSENNGRYKGFQPVYKQWDSSFKNFKEQNPNGWRINVVAQSKTLFKEYLELCKAEKIKVIFVYPPEYIEAQKLCLNRDSVTNIFKKFALTYNIPFFDFSKDSICLDTINFYNSQHLNMTGVRKFDLELINDLKEKKIIN